MSFWENATVLISELPALSFTAFSPETSQICCCGSRLLLSEPPATPDSWQTSPVSQNPAFPQKLFPLSSQPCSRGAAGRFPALRQRPSCLGAGPHALPTGRSHLHGSLVPSVLLLAPRVLFLPLDGWKLDSAGLRALSRAAAVCSPTASPDAPSAPCHPSSLDHLIVSVLKQSCRAR